MILVQVRPSRRQARAAGLTLTAAAVITLVVGIAYAFFSSGTTSPGNKFALGTVTLRTTSSTACSYASLSPGDLAGSQTCSLAVAYAGSLTAYMGLDVQIQAKAGTGPGAKPLFDGSNTTGLTLSISDGHNTYTVPTGAGSTGGTCPAGYTCWASPNDVAGTYTPSASLSFTNGSSATFTITPRFLSTVSNAYQGGTATVTVTAHAVQQPGNPIPTSCTTSTIGQPCSGSGFAWN